MKMKEKDNLWLLFSANVDWGRKLEEIDKSWHYQAWGYGWPNEWLLE